MIFTARSDGWFNLGERQVQCALGPGGVVAAAEKREGDGATPLGVWPLRRVLFRPDRGSAPITRLDAVALDPGDGWCDAPEDLRYNQQVVLPYPASAERLWRDDAIYDVIVILGYNDAPVIAGKGSAIFLHIARDDYSPTQGCVALWRADLEVLLARAAPGDALAISRA